MLSRSYSIIAEPDQTALAGYLDGFLGLLDASPSPEYLTAYFTGAADFARQSLSI
jgi:hypothetical protein